MEKKSVRYNSIDGLRAIASIGIIAMHVYLLGAFAINSYAGNVIGTLSEFIELFFIISGFSLCCGYYEKVRTGSFSPDGFYRSRYIKLLPLFAIVVLIESVVSFQYPTTVFDVLADMSLLFAFFSNNSLTVGSIGWTLGVIFAFYVFFPFFVFMIWNKRRGITALLATFLLRLLCQHHYLNIGEYQNIILWLFHFTLGGVIYLYKDELNELVMNKFWRRMLEFWVLVFTLLYFCGRAFSVSVDFATPFVFSLWVVLAITVKPKVLEGRIFQFIGSISFEMYLVQMVVFRGCELVGVIRLLGSGTIGYIYATCIVILGSMIFAYSFQQISRRIANR